MPNFIDQAESELVSQQRRRPRARKLWLAFAISILVLLPCVWHREIEAGDLGSHTYNAWLTLLIERGEAPGLYTVTQWNNILADIVLSWLGRLFGFLAAEKIVMGLAVIIFFWGAFTLITVVTQRKPWFLVPAIAMIAYGYTFQMGFLNYYLSVGLAFWVIALLWEGGTTFWIIALALSGLVLSAHLMGFMWLFGTVAYILLAKTKWAGGLSTGRWGLPIGTLIAILGVHSYVAFRFRPYGPVRWHIYNFLGFDQLVLYSHRYRIVAIIVIMLTISISFPEVIRQRRNHEFWRTVRIPLELWLMVVFATAMLWDGVAIPDYATGFTYVPARLTSVTAVLGLCILGFAEPRRWHAVAIASCSVVFFAWMYQDTGRINKMEAQADKLVNDLPQGARVIQTIFMPIGARVGMNHIVDRACIGKCFAYANYEPASRQFRIRARPGNQLVTASSVDSEAMQHGTYTVRSEDLPLVRIYQCDPRDLGKLCIQDLAAGDINGRDAYLPNY
jgi:MFS family permease